MPSSRMRRPGPKRSSPQFARLRVRLDDRDSSSGPLRAQDFADFLTGTPDEVVKALRTMRNIAPHSGCRAMDDEFLWASLTVELPPCLARWKPAARVAGSN